MNIEFELSDYQKRYADAFKILSHSGPRRAGRTYAICTVYITKAFHNLGQWIEIVDHYPYWRRNPEYFYTMFGGIFSGIKENEYLNGDPIYKIEISRSRQRIRISKVKYEERRFMPYNIEDETRL